MNRLTFETSDLSPQLTTEFPTPISIFHMHAPEVYQLEDYSNPRLRISWNAPERPNGRVLSYTLFRVTLQTSISFDPGYTPINRTNEKFELCRGSSLFSYLDSDVLAASVYEYYVAVATTTGQINSPLARTYP